MWMRMGCYYHGYYDYCVCALHPPVQKIFFIIFMFALLRWGSLSYFDLAIAVLLQMLFSCMRACAESSRSPPGVLAAIFKRTAMGIGKPAEFNTVLGI